MSLGAIKSAVYRRRINTGDCSGGANYCLMTGKSWPPASALARMTYVKVSINNLHVLQTYSIIAWFRAFLHESP